MKNPEEIRKAFTSYKRNRILLMLTMRKKREILNKIIKDGIDSEEEMKMAKTCCAIIGADLYAEDTLLLDKTGEFNLDEDIENKELDKYDINPN